MKKPRFVEGEIYHIYNRGVEKRKVFLDKQDYLRFIHDLFELNDEEAVINTSYYLNSQLLRTPHSVLVPKERKVRKLLVEILIFTLMPNHFHLLLKQKPTEGIERFMRSLGTKYVQYFNKRYERVGPLFQDTYKAVLVETDNQLLHLSRYIHLQGILLGSYSSYADYLGKRKTEWLQPEEILSFFKTAQRTSLKDIVSYESFVEDYQQPPPEILGE